MATNGCPAPSSSRSNGNVLACRLALSERKIMNKLNLAALESVSIRAVNRSTDSLSEKKKVFDMSLSSFKVSKKFCCAFRVSWIIAFVSILWTAKFLVNYPDENCWSFSFQSAFCSKVLFQCFSARPCLNCNCQFADWQSFDKVVWLNW